MVSRKARLNSTATLIQQRYGPQALRRASEITASLPPHIATGFAALDGVTGCGGVPRGAITLLSGQATSGKTTVAYKTAAQCQTVDKRGTVALLDLSRTADPDYLARCGVDLERLLIVRPTDAQQTLRLLLDLARRVQVRLILLDSLPNLLAMDGGAQALRRGLRLLHSHLRQTQAALLVLDDCHAAWLRWLNWDGSALVRPWAALHVELRREAWLMQRETLAGYRAQAQVLKTRWGRGGKAAVAIEFNGTVKAQGTW